MLLLLVLFSFFVAGFETAKFTETSDAIELVHYDYSRHSVNGNLKIDQGQDLRRIAIKSIDKCDEKNISMLMKMQFDLFSTGVWNKMVKKDSFNGIMYLLKHFLVNKRERRRAFRDSIRYGANSIFYYTLEKYKYKVKPNSKHKQELLVKLACEKKRYWILSNLANYEFNVNYIKKSKFDGGKSILHDAVISGDFDLVKALLKFKDIELNCVDENGNIPLHYASNIQIYLILVEHKADPFVKNKSGFNSLFSAHPSVTSRLKLFQIYFYDKAMERVLEDSIYFLASSEEICWYNNLEDSYDERTKWMTLLIERFIVPRSREEFLLKFDEIYNDVPFELKNGFYGISSNFNGPVEVYRFIGSVVAEALLIKVPIRFKFAPSILKILFGKFLNFEDLKEDDPFMHNSMMKDFESEFEMVKDEIAVDLMYTKFKEQIDQFKIGFYSKISEEILTAFFTVSEFQSKFFQPSEKIDRYKIYRKFEFCGNFRIENVEIFWAAMDFLTENELIKFEKMIASHRSNIMEETSMSLNLPISINSIEKFVEIIRNIIKK